jgi:hypothetical protein
MVCNQNPPYYGLHHGDTYYLKLEVTAEEAEPLLSLAKLQLRPHHQSFFELLTDDDDDRPPEWSVEA